MALERYSRPETVEECFRLLAEADQRPALLAGGTELNVRGHEEITHVIDLQDLARAGGPFGAIRTDGAGAAGALELGALVTLSALRRHEACRGPLLTALREAAAGYAVLALQNRSTVGGRVAVDRGDQDLPPALLALGAKLRVLRPASRAAGANGGDGANGGANGGTGPVEEALVDYPTGAAARRALEGALIAGVSIPLGPGRSALRRFGRTAVDAPLANAACAVRGAEVRLAVNVQGSGAAGLARLTETEALVASWNGERPADWRAAAREQALTELAEYGDAWASGAYRRDLAATMVVRSLAAALGEEEVV